MIYTLPCGDLVLGCGRCSGALWRAPDLHQDGSRPHRRGPLGGFVVEATAALFILCYLVFLWLASRWDQKSSLNGIVYSVVTGVCVGAGTIVFFLLFQKGGPLSSVPAILAGAAIMAIAGILFFHETPSWQRLLGVVFAIAGLLLLRR